MSSLFFENSETKSFFFYPSEPLFDMSIRKKGAWVLYELEMWGLRAINKERQGAKMR